MIKEIILILLIKEKKIINHKKKKKIIIIKQIKKITIEIKKDKILYLLIIYFLMIKKYTQRTLLILRLF